MSDVQAAKLRPHLPKKGCAYVSESPRKTQHDLKHFLSNTQCAYKIETDLKGKYFKYKPT